VIEQSPNDTDEEAARQVGDCGIIIFAVVEKAQMLNAITANTTQSAADSYIYDLNQSR
jgi:hypothetical protein